MSPFNSQTFPISLPGLELGAEEQFVIGVRSAIIKNPVKIHSGLVTEFIGAKVAQGDSFLTSNRFVLVSDRPVEQFRVTSDLERAFPAGTPGTYDDVPLALVVAVGTTKKCDYFRIETTEDRYYFRTRKDTMKWMNAVDQVLQAFCSRQLEKTGARRWEAVTAKLSNQEIESAREKVRNLQAEYFDAGKTRRSRKVGIERLFFGCFGIFSLIGLIVCLLFLHAMGWL